MNKIIKKYLKNLVNSCLAGRQVCLAGVILFNLSFTPQMINLLTDNVIDKFFSISLPMIEPVTREVREIMVLATGYSSTVDQTDDTPFITANGETVKDGIVAANFLPFHTKIKMPEIFGEKVFQVKDRMNSRYTKANPPRLDIWFASRALAKKFGLQKVKIVVLN